MDEETGKTLRTAIRAIERAVVLFAAVIGLTAFGIVHELKPEEPWWRVVLEVLVAPLLIGRYGLAPWLRAWWKRKIERRQGGGPQ